MLKLIRRSLLSLSTIALSGTAAHAIDVAPGDWQPAPAGTNLGMLYLNYNTATTLKVDGAGKIQNSRLDVSTAILRYARYEEVGGMPVTFNALLPFGGFPTARIGGVDQQTSSGVADAIFLAALWPIHTSGPWGTHLAIAGYVTAPIGNYNFNTVSIGSGTVTYTPQLGLQQGIGNGFFLEATLDATFAADHHEQGLKLSMDASAQLQAYLRYQFSSTTSISGGYSGKFGGKQYVDDVYTGQKTRVDELRVFANHWIGKTTQLQGMVGTDIAAEGGFRNNLVSQLRILVAF